ncbi:MAG: radical SAM protein [Clostridiales bacterium]|nr:radical SAM protein [Clostridiales bacterium]
MKCTLCPRNCNVERTTRRGSCRTDGILLSRIARHDWEEPCISGSVGSGTVFFAGCNLHCRFCQNYDISIKPHGVEVSPERLADVFLYVQDMGWKNINLVTPAHFADKVAVALHLAKPKLTIPVVYNTSAYEKVEAIRALNGLVDVYLPDLKFCLSEVSGLLAGAKDYFEVANKAIVEMRRQQPQDEFDSEGYMTKGVLIRHLVLPSYVEDSKRVLDWIAQFDSNVQVSLMSQYFPAREDLQLPQLNRRLYKHEYDSVKEYFFNVGLSNGYCQDVTSATVDYLPDFDDNAIEEVLKNVPHVFTKN